MENVICIKRSEAAEIIETLRKIVARPTGANSVETLREVQRVLEGRGNVGFPTPIPPLTPCPGEAHKPHVGGMIDHCGCCAPRWGLVGPRVRIT